MSLAYTPPGVTISEDTTVTFAPLLAKPGNICIIGMSQGTVQRTEAVVLDGTTAALLTYVPAGASQTAGSIVSVQDALNPGIPQALYGSANYAAGDYTFSAGAHTIARSGNSNIPSLNTVYVTYTYTPADYFSPVRLFSLSDVEDRFGSGWDTTGTVVNSPLSFAARLAFENGAASVVCQPLFFLSNGVKSQPNATQAADPNRWSDTYYSLRDIEDIDIFVPVAGQSMANVNDATWLSIAETGQDHIAWLNTENRFAILLLGEDASASTNVAQLVTLQTHAITLQNRYGGALSQSTAMVSPAKFGRQQTTSSSTTPIGGQYVCAALSGMLASIGVSVPLTRRAISGIFSVDDYRSLAQKNADATNGLLVVEQKGQIVQPRHAITLDNTATSRRELSVVRSKFRIINSIKLSLDTQIIGKLIADALATTIISDLVGNVLDALKGTRDVVAYGNVQTRISSLDPTHAEVRFAYLPAFPINYIDVIFSIDLSLGSFTLLPANNTAGANALSVVS